MSSLTVPKLVLRADKGAPLTNAEIDANWTTLRSFCNSLSALFGVSLNTDGTLKNNTVEESDIVARQIGADKMKLTALPAYDDAGTTNAMLIANAGLNAEITAYENKMIFFVRALTGNTGPTTLKVDANAPIPVKKRGGLVLEAGDIQAGQVVALEYYDGVFHLIGGSGASGVSSTSVIDDTGNLQGVLFNATAEIEAVAAQVTFAHGFNAHPDTWQVMLECSYAGGDTSYDLGDAIPISDLTGNGTTYIGPAFSARVSSDSIIVTRNTTLVYDASGTALDIATPKWKIRVKAMRERSPSLNLQPALQIYLVNNEGAISYGQYLFGFIHSKDGNHGFGYYGKVVRVDGQTGGVESVGGVPPDGSVAARYGNMSLYRDAGGVDQIALATSKGLHVFTAQKPGGGFSVNSIGVVDHSKEKLLVASGAGSSMDMWMGPQQKAGAGCYVGNYLIKKYHGVGAGTTPYTAINFLNATDAAGMATENDSILSLTYNQAKQRIYLVRSLGIMQIYELSQPLDVWLTSGALAYANLTYVNMMALGGAIGADGADAVTVEFDLGTGEEYAVVCSGVAGITRIPWREP